MYEADDNRYCYPGTTVLKNKEHAYTQIDLDKVEKYWTSLRAAQPMPRGRYNLAHYRAIHRHLFGDVYTWAGRFREVRISRGNSTFCYPENIKREIASLFEHLAGDNVLRDLEAEDFSRKAAHFISELNVIHPFREGNGRTQNIFLQILADQASHPLDFPRLDPEAMLQAMIAGFNGNEELLSDLILALMRVRS
jgi:cell filamentation protein